MTTANRRNSYLLKKYPESFFEDNFLYIYFVSMTSNILQCTITKSEADDEYINVDMLKRCTEHGDAVRPYFLFVEANKSFINKELNVTTTTSAYDITNLYLSDADGNEIDTTDTNADFIVNMDIVKKEDKVYTDYFIAALYDTDGVLIDTNYVKDIDENTQSSDSFSCKINFSGTNKKIGSIKVFAWSFLDKMTPVSDVKTLSLAE